MLNYLRLRVAVRAAGVHLLCSLAIVSLAGALVFGVWFPYPYRELAGGRQLFLLIMAVDVVCGPLLTALLFSPTKSRRELTLDLSLVAFVQLSALIYGVHSISQARPVVLAFETDRLVAVSAAQINVADLSQALPEFKALSWAGPVLLGTRPPKDGAEMLQSINMSIQGIEPSARPGWWEPYAKSQPRVLQRMKKLDDLRAQGSIEVQASIDAAARRARQTVDALYYLPLTSRKILDGWIALLDRNGNIVGYAPVDGFTK